ncbi:flagellar hook assembly protein FlgD [Actibacterium sp. MT2.3-13A]|uniref:flagellar hook assembly protein FlgD n=1 Tax=Actibacterium sp. MT2.3-13A TaxID=2828332 RepID=UPI001BA8BC35|nr:flagellar hook assembly protein FlgD [Actibacterium sp. MT2.3-13A]
MTVDSTSAAQPAAPVAASRSAMTKLGADYDSFLRLLTAQIANQDPLEPMDSTTFVSQLAQLSQVEQSIVTNANLEGISSQLSSVGAMADMQLIGRDVTLPSGRIELQGGSGTFSFRLSEAAQSVKAVLRHADGTVIREIRGLPTDPGTRHDLVWDGKDSYGLPVPDGVFEVAIEAVDAEDAPVSYAGYATTRVEQLAFRDGAPMLVLRNGEEVRSTQVLGIE